jgi:hypothetical protein
MCAIILRLAAFGTDANRGPAVVVVSGLLAEL